MSHWNACVSFATQSEPHSQDVFILLPLLPEVAWPHLSARTAGPSTAQHQKPRRTPAKGLPHSVGKTIKMLNIESPSGAKAALTAGMLLGSRDGSRPY